MSRPLRIAMIHLSEFRLDSRVQRQAYALAERGDEVEAIGIGAARGGATGSRSARADARAGELLRVGAGTIRVRVVPGAKASGGAAGYLRAYAAFCVRAGARLTANDLLRRFDVVQVHNMPNALVAATLAPWLRGTPLLLDMHDTFAELFATKFPGASARLARTIELEERVSARMATRVIAVTEQARRRLEARGVAVGRIAVVMNSPDERLFGAAREPVRWPAEGPLRLLYHGGLAPRFGVETAIRAVGLLGEEPDTRPIHLRVCGAGDAQDRGRLRSLARAVAPGMVDISNGPIPLADIPGELACAHMGVVPTLADPFTELLLPVKLLECVHMGLPVLASRLPGIASYFDDTQLALFTPGDPIALSAELLALSADLSCARAHARATEARRVLQTLSWPRQRERYLALIDELADTNAARPSPTPLTPPAPAVSPLSASRASASSATRSASATIDSPLSSRG